MGRIFQLARESYEIRKSIIQSDKIRLFKLSLFKSQKIFFHNKYDLSIFLRSNIVKKKQAEIISGSGVNINIKKKNIITYVKIALYLLAD